METAAHVEIVQALAAEHRRELSEARALCVLYRALLEEAGINCPEDERSAEALRRFRSAFIAAGENDKAQPRDLTDDWWDIPWPFMGPIPGAPIPALEPTVGVSRVVA